MAILKRSKDAAAKDAKEEKKAPAKKTRQTSSKAAAKKPAAKKAATKKTEAAPKKVVASGDAYRVLMRPLVTEKSAKLASDGVYTFQVAPGTDKVHVRQAVKALYGVQPIRVNILNQKGKRVRFGKVRGQRNHWRKAYVYLKKGQHIDVYEGV